MEKQPILIISGTNRPGSNAMKIARIVEEQYRVVSVPAEILSLTDLPPEAFSPTIYLDKPPIVRQMLHRVLDAPGLHMITPEYNGSFPGVLKYFIDLLKFPESFDRKPVAFIGESAGVWGALRAVEHLQQVFAYRNAHLYPDRVFIPGVMQKLGSDDQLTDSAIQDRIAKQVAGFAHFISRF
jgi:NAD(P)H-dependent FMN reductase